MANTTVTASCIWIKKFEGCELIFKKCQITFASLNHATAHAILGLLKHALVMFIKHN